MNQLNILLITSEDNGPQLSCYGDSAIETPNLDRLAAEGARFALAHYDLGFGVKDQDVAEAARLSPYIGAVMAPGGLIISGQPLVGFTEVTGPDSIPVDRYLFYRA